MTATKSDYVNYRISKSKEVFEDAKLLAGNGRWNSCMNRLYYSSFYLISALLFQTEIKPVTHKGTKTQFNLHYIKPGLVSKDFGKLYSNLFDWRQENDYADFVDFNADLVIPLMEQVAEFNQQITDLIRK